MAPSMTVIAQTVPTRSAGENGEAPNELSQADEVADGFWRVHVSGKVQWPRAAEDAKKNAAAVIEKR